MRRVRLVSLRARLLAGLVLLTAAGLVLAGVITYRAERSFLVGQVDQQVRLSLTAVEDQVDAKNHLRRPITSVPGVPRLPAGEGSGIPAANAFGGGAGPLAESLSDPIGTFGEHLNRYGVQVGQAIAIGYTAEYPPTLPVDLGRYVTLPRSAPKLFTFPSSRPGLSYRVLIKPSDVGYGFTVIGVALGNLDASLRRLQEIEAVVIASVLVALAILAWLVIRIGLRPLDRIGMTAGAIAAGDLSRRVSPADSRTEVGRLGLALNAMLGQIERAFAQRKESEDRLRRFLSDASHELRTPLTSIRGYAELFRLGATANPKDTARAMGRIEEEASRMGVLVDELLALARLDEMPVTTREPVDLVPLVGDAGRDAQAVAPERSITVSVRPASRGGRARHIVSGDVHQLRQVLANLMTNAIKHTPAGTPIELVLTRRDGLERIEVRDHGPGLPEDAQNAVFERFWRAEGGRERGKAGAGLGLAIVAEIVEAHDGSVTAQNAPGGGATFVIELPAARAAGAKGASPSTEDAQSRDRA